MSIRQIAHNIYKKIETSEHELRYVFLEITRRCNLNCLHCGSDCKNETNVNELNTAQWLEIIDYFYENAGKNSVSSELSFVITGGEPLLYLDLDLIGRHINKRGFRWAVVTNGILLDKKRMTKLENAGIYSLTLSIDGPQEQHNWLRNSKIAFERLTVALKALGKSKIAIKDAVSCVFPSNLDKLDQVAEILIKNKIASWRIFRIFPSGRAENNPKLLLNFSDTQKLFDWIAKMRPVYKQRGLNLSYSCEGFVPIERDLQIRDHGFFCWAGINIASILSDGTITGCTNNASRFHVGNILKDDFITLWNNDFKLFRNRNWTKTGACEKCEYWKDCRGSSIHLWHDNAEQIAFCYMKDINAGKV